ncbi:hypothetical protein NLJ89_g304 [Agrocybe chaxingu]|uniref:Chloride channel protein n=1 Tax=Agrocybe chaxingu TaxID=84603 RepID=A0A9W8N255_9AGAR|nr:hypothetical protein NLJ89_g304 [Agrocybe chaxingu]
MPSGYSSVRPDVVYEEDQYDLTEDGRIPIPYRRVAKYQDGNTIDWLHEEGLERERNHALQSQAGVRGVLLPALESARMWFIVIVTGIGIGVVGAWLDVLVKWLGDLREGRCSYGFFYSLSACCADVDAHFILEVRPSPIARLLSGTYHYAKTVPEIKAILGGYVFDGFLSTWTLLIKALGLALSVGSGLSLGKEGPLVHVACCMAFLISRIFKEFRHNEAQKRRVLAAAAAAGVSVAFGSPLGGVLFGLEELDTFANESDVMWRAFVASAVAAVSLQWVNPFGTAKLVLFQVTFSSDTWRAFELIPWVTLGVIGGVLGSLLIRLNVEIALYRRHSVLGDWPILEVVSVSAVTAAISYLASIVFARASVQTSELVASLFQECDISKGDYHGLCNPTAMGQNIFLLCLTAMLKIVLTAWTFGMQVPAGIFLPTIAIVSLVVILFELTGALSHVLPIMIGVMTSKWVGDAMGKDGIYSVWIAMRRYPWLPPTDFRDQGETGGNIMKPLPHIIAIEDGVTTVGELKDALNEHHFHGFPVVDSHQEFVGYATRQELITLLERRQLSDSDSVKKCTFSQNYLRVPIDERVDLSDALEDSIVQLRKEVPLELVVSMFQKLNLRQIIFTHAGKLTGLVTKRDVVNLLTNHFPHAAALAQQTPRSAR